MIRLTLMPEQETLIFAGQELVSHLRMLDLELDDYEITLRMDAEQSSVGDDHYSFAFDKTDSWVTGSNPYSVLLGVYGYLQKIGFVFVRPGRGGTVVPKLVGKEALFCEKVYHSASFKHRGVCIEGADSLENVLDFIDWMPKVGFNSFFLQFQKPDVFFERWYDHENNPLLAPEKKSRRELDGMEEEVTRAMKLRGILDHRVGHGWTARALGLSCAGWHFQKETLEEEKRQLTALVKGKRALWGGVPANTNLCYANPRACKALIQQVVDYAESHPDVDLLHFWLADANNNLCECEACAGTLLADQYVEILNGIDEALTEKGLDTKIVFLLYQELLYAPERASVKNLDRFCMMFAPISRTFERSYPRKKMTEKIPPYVRNKLKLPETVEGNLAHYQAWKEVFSGDSFFYDYPLGRAHYGDFGYMKIAKTIYEDIHALKALGSNGYMSCQELRAMTPSGFPDFCMGQALLDESISFETLKKRYFQALYGQDWERVTDYLETLSAWSDTDYFNGHGPRVQPEKQNQFRRIREIAVSFMEWLDSHRAKEAEEEDEWAFLAFHGQYCILLAGALEALCAGEEQKAGERFGEFCSYIQENELRWQSRLDVYRVIEVATHYAGFSAPV